MNIGSLCSDQVHTSYVRWREGMNRLPAGRCQRFFRVWDIGAVRNVYLRLRPVFLHVVCVHRWSTCPAQERLTPWSYKVNVAPQRNMIAHRSNACGDARTSDPFLRPWRQRSRVLQELGSRYRPVGEPQ